MDIITTRRTKVEKGYELLADITVGTATTNVDITGLNIGKGDEVVLVGSFTNNTSAYTPIYVTINGNNTTTNYHHQFISTNGTSISANRFNNPTLSDMAESSRELSVIRLKLTNSGYFIGQNSSSRDVGTSTARAVNLYATSTFTVSTITSIRFSCTLSQFGIGSRFQLYKIGGA